MSAFGFKFLNVWLEPLSIGLESLKYKICVLLCPSNEIIGLLR